MKIVTIHEAKTNLSRLIETACEGEEILIARGSEPVARLVALADTKGRRRPGSLKGKLHVGSEFFEPLPAAELSAWSRCQFPWNTGCEPGCCPVLIKIPLIAC